MKTAEELRERYGSGPVPLEIIARDFLGIKTKSEAYRKASRGDIGIRTFKLIDSTKAPWLVDLDDLGSYIDQRRKLG